MPTPPVRLIGVPYDRGSSFLQGPAEAPPLIREALWSPAGNSWSELGVDVRPLLDDAGDLEFHAEADPRAVIDAGVAAVVAAGRTPLVLGGDHSISYPVVRALARSSARFDVLHIDAHADLYEAFEGDPFSHASPFARILEDGLAGRLVQVGIRTLTGEQRRQVERFGVEVVSMADWSRGRRFRLEGPVFVSIDLDGLDPAFAPGVSHREPGGLSVREVIGIVHDLDVPIVGADVVELNPRRDPEGLTAVVAAKLVKELAARMASNPPPAPAALRVAAADLSLDASPDPPHR